MRRSASTHIHMYEVVVLRILASLCLQLVYAHVGCRLGFAVLDVALSILIVFSVASERYRGSTCKFPGFHVP